MTATKAVFYDTCAITVIIEGGYQMSNKIIKSVSFNVTNSEDEIMLKAIKRRNFSGYVKKLIMADLNMRKGLIIDEKKSEVINEVPVEKLNEKLSMDQLKKRSQLNQQNKKSVNQPQAPKVFKPN
jgi:hypothetical protein